jgi:hypothetical protein
MLIALSAVALISSDVFAGNNDHFARQRREAAARREAAEHHGHHSHAAHWGGTTTRHRWYPSHGGGTVIHRRVQVVPVYPFGYGFPSYGGYDRFYRSPYYAPVGQHIHIHREIRR